MLLRYLLEKEFKQIWRNAFLPRLIAAYPILVLLVFPWVANLEVKDIKLCVIDNDGSSYSRQLIEKIAASGYFHLSQHASTYTEALGGIESGSADVVLEIAPSFEKELLLERRSSVLIAANSVNGIKGTLGANYLTQIINDFVSLLQEARGESGGLVSLEPRYRFNPSLDYKTFMIPALMVLLLTIFCGFLPALNIVSEKERGTIEQINVTPVRKSLFILSKLIPYWLIGIFVFSVSLLLAALLYDLRPVGNVFNLYLFALIYVIIISGFGLVVSNYSATMQQAMFVMFFFIVIMLLMSGMFTPVSSMPTWAQTIAAANPLRYFVEAMRAIYLKGSTLLNLLMQLGVLLGIASFFSIWATLSYRKR